MKPLIFDASAIFVWFEGRPGHRKMEEWLDLGRQGKRPLAMSAVNWGEVYYSIWQRRGEQTALQLSAILSHMPIEIVAADLELARLAGQLKARHGLPYADGFTAGLAILRNADVATSDRHFQLVAHLISVRMLN